MMWCAGTQSAESLVCPVQGTQKWPLVPDLSMNHPSVTGAKKKKKQKHSRITSISVFFFNAATHGASEGKGHKGLWMRSTMFCYETAPKKTRLLLVYSVINNSILTYGSRETSKKFMSVLNWTELLIHIPTARGTTSVLYLQRPHSKTYTVCAYASTQLSTNDIKPALKTTQ